MCKIKEYTKNVNSLNESISFRMDFFSVPSFKNEFVENIGEILGFPCFQERLITEEEKQKIDIDSVVNTLDNSIEEIISTKIYKYFDFKISNIDCELYISHYYIFLYIDYSGYDGDGDYLAEVCNIFNQLREFSSKLTPQKLSFITSYHAQADEGQLWKVFDKEAFPLMESDNLVNGRYADQHEYEALSIYLVREIRKGYDKETQNIIYDVNVTSYATRVINSIKNIDFNDIFSQMLDNSHKEVTRCFTPKFIGSH